MEAAYLVNEELNMSQKEISIIDGNHCYLEESKFSIVKTKNNYHENPNTFNFIILGENNEELNGRYSNSDIVINNQNDKSILYLKSINTNGIIRREIYTDDEQDKSISVIIPKNKSSYKIEFINLAKEEKEYFEMKSDVHFQSCDIIYGNSNKKNEVNIICEIIIRKNHGNDYGDIGSGSDCEIKIASGVDYIFMIGLASFFFCESVNQHANNKNYDNIALLSMPTEPTIMDKCVPKDKFKKENYLDVTSTKTKDPKNSKKKSSFWKFIKNCLNGICDVCGACCNVIDDCCDLDCCDGVIEDCCDLDCCDGDCCDGDCDGCDCDGCDCGGCDCGDCDCCDGDCDGCDCGDCDCGGCDCGDCDCGDCDCGGCDC